MGYTGSNQFVIAEIAYPGIVKRGDVGMAVKRVQEHCNLHGVHIGIDKDFGGITEDAVGDLQDRFGLPRTGIVDEATWDALVAPLVEAWTFPDIPTSGPDAPVVPIRLLVPQMMGIVVENFLKAVVREVGGDNKGPWVRCFMRGREGILPTGEHMEWCMGFMMSVYEWVCEMLGVAPLYKWTDSCNNLARQARKLNKLVQGEQATNVTVPALFLEETADVADPNEKYRHTGLWMGKRRTIEGNFGRGMKAGVHEYRRDLTKVDVVPLV